MKEQKPIASEKDGHPTAKGAVTGGVLGGVAGGMAAGAAVGGMTGPAGAAIGAAVGAVVGAVAGRSKVDPVVEEAYWRENYASRPYVANGSSFDEYSPAYRYGADAYARNPGRTYDEVEADLERDWPTARGNSSLEWDNAKHATRDAWHRLGNAVERAVPGDSDGDGR